MTTHIRVSREQAEELEKVRVSLSLKSVSAVIQHLLSDEVHESSDDAAEISDDNSAGEGRRLRKINVRPALYSLDSVSERVGMLDYLTGFDRPAVDLMIKRIEEVILCVLDLSCFHVLCSSLL